MTDFTVQQIESDFDCVIDEIISIQSDLAIRSQLIKHGVNEAKEGLLICGYSKEEFLKLLASGASIIIARDKNKPVGYILTTPPKLFLPKYLKAKKWWKNEELKLQYERIILNNAYVYFDQFGVLFNYHDKGVSNLLLEEFKKIYKNKITITLIMDEPIKNIKSKNTALKNNAIIICDILFRKYGTIANFKGKLYLKQL